MNSKTTRGIVKKLKLKYGYTEEEIRELILLYYRKVRDAMAEGRVSEDGSFNEIRIRMLGRFTAPGVKLAIRKMRIMNDKNKETDRKEYSVTLQGEPQMFVENNEPFYFVTEEPTPELKKGDRIEIIYTYTGRAMPKNSLLALDLEILDSKPPFYKAAIDLSERYVFERNKLNKIRI